MSASSNSGSSIKRFFVYHCEKLILGLSIALLGLFFWFGYSTPNFDDSTPSGLVDQASQVGRRMTDPQAWDKIREAREGDSDVFNRIVSSPELSATNYAIGPASLPVKRSTMRKDASILAPESLVATAFQAPILIQPRAALDEDDDPLPLEFFPPVKATLAGSQTLAQSNFDSEEEDEFGQSSRSSRKKSSREKGPEPVDAGTFISTATNYKMPGVRGEFATTQVKAYNMVGVAVTGIVKHEAMWLDFKNRYQSSLGYHPDRDTPRYDYLQVRRREVKQDGSFGAWTDLSKRLADQRDYFPARLETAPEVVGPSEYDGLITQPIPPFLGVDYKTLANHPNVPIREFHVPEPFDEGDTGDPLSDAGEDEDIFQGGQRPSRPSSAIRGGQGGRNGEERLSRSSTRSRSGSGDPLARSADDVTDYLEITVRDEPQSPYKVVRFFDIYGVSPGKTYQYQTRVWLRDPNNEDPELHNDIAVDANGLRGGGNDDFNDGPSGSRRKKTAEDEMMERFATKTAIGNSMIDPLSRRRLREAREEKSDGVSTYYVSEPYGEDGKMVEIQVPAGQDYLKYARPSRWSDPVQVSVKASPAFVYAGQPVESRRLEAGRGTVLDGEPTINVASGKIMSRSENMEGVKVPFRAQVRAGDLLDFNKPTHVLHPVTRAIQRVEGVEVVTGNVVLDVSESVQLAEFSKKSPVPYFYPGEVLVLDATGELSLRNDIEDRTDYSITMLDPDEEVVYGSVRRPRKKKSTEADEYEDDLR